MLITRTITKKLLENIVHESFSKFGSFSSSSLLDSLKLLGFAYATNAGISINIEDLKTPSVKKDFLKQAEEEVEIISKEWEQGFVSETERFQTIIDSWNFATESLKNRIVDYYQNFDPANNLYIMAFSGARGNMSQVRQLVGMRGLMSDQEGKIIDIPIQANFREGLSLIDYIISSYGARKGIVDTALKTADSGYLTRRLIYLTQEVIIREIDCKTKNGISFLITKETKGKNILGRSIIHLKNENQDKIDIKKFNNFSRKLPKLLDNQNIEYIKKFAPLKVKVRSSLTCEAYGSVCQICYGADLAHQQVICLGEAVGIIAAQSIGEPGTQLTMRTFHTGGIFTSESLKQIVAPFSGKIFIPDSLNAIPYRTNHGKNVLKLQQEILLNFINWEGKLEKIFLPIGAFLYLSSATFVKANDLIAEYATQSIISGIRRLKPVYSRFSGEVRFENLAILRKPRDKKKRTIKLIQDDGIIWLASGKIFSIPKEVNFLFSNSLKENKSFAKIKLISPFSGIIKREKNSLVLFTKTNQIVLDFSKLNKKYSNCNCNFFFNIKNYQYVDQNTVLGYLNIFPKYSGKVYSIRKKQAKYFSNFFLITESDIWKIHSDQVNIIAPLNNNDRKIEKFARANSFFNMNSLYSKNGYLIKKDGHQLIYQKANPIFLTAGTISYYNHGDFVLENKLFATLVNYTQQTEDIVQGLPKIEELIEGRKPKRKAFLAPKPGIFLDSKFFFKLAKYDEVNRIPKFQFFESTKNTRRYSKRKEEIIEDSKKLINIQLLHSLDYKEKNGICLYKNFLIKIKSIAPCFSPISSKTVSGKEVYYFERKYEEDEKIKEDILFNQNEYERENLDFLNPYSKELENDKKRENKLFLDRLILKNKKITRKWVSVESFIKKEKHLSLGRIYKLRNNKKTLLTKISLKGVYRNVKLRNIFLFRIKKNNYILGEFLNPGINYSIPLEMNLIPKIGDYLDLGEVITDGTIDIHELLSIFAKYHCNLDGTKIGTIKSLNKFQLILVNSIQAIYQSQGVNIAGKHIEIIIRQMTSKIVIKKSGDSPFIPGELVRLGLIVEISKAFEEAKSNFSPPLYEPFLLSATNSSVNREGFLAAAGFQETKRILTKAALEGKVEWLRGLKESVIAGKLIPAGSAFLNYKNYLDYLIFFKQTLKNIK